MKRTRVFSLAIVGSLVLVGGAVGILAIHFDQPAPEDRYITINAHKYAYDPAVVRVNKGDRVHLSLSSADVTHGFFLEGYDLDAQIPSGEFTFRVRHPSGSGKYETTDEVSFVANRTGKFRYRCSNTCGYMHPFMQGELIVNPNYLYSSSIGMSFGLCLGMLWVFRRNGTGGGE